jgi:hypothetical protein
MVDMSAISGLATSLRSVVEITKAMKDIDDANLIQTKVFELTREIMSAQQCALAAQAAQFDLLQNKRDLEEEITKLKAWNAEKDRYELQSVAAGALAMVVKESVRGTAPIHWLCANCYQNNKKRFLQAHHTDTSFVYHKCRECGDQIMIPKPPSPPPPAMATRRYDPPG